MLENQIARSTRHLFYIYFCFGFAITYYLGKRMWDENVRYRNYVLYPDNMKKIDAFKAWVLRNYEYYDARFDLPKELSIRSLTRFFISVKRVHRVEKKQRQKDNLNQIVEDGKVMDKKVEDMVNKVDRQDLPFTRNEPQSGGAIERP